MKNSMKIKMCIHRLVNTNNITIGVSFIGDKKENAIIKAMLLDVASLNGHGDNLSFVSPARDSVFFRFKTEELKMKYSSCERKSYMSILCKLQRYGQAHGCEIVIKTI